MVLVSSMINIKNLSFIFLWSRLLYMKKWMHVNVFFPIIHLLLTFSKVSVSHILKVFEKPPQNTPAALLIFSPFLSILILYCVCNIWWRYKQGEKSKTRLQNKIESWIYAVCWIKLYRRSPGAHSSMHINTITQKIWFYKKEMEATKPTALFFRNKNSEKMMRVKHRRFCWEAWNVDRNNKEKRWWWST